MARKVGADIPTPIAQVVKMLVGGLIPILIGVPARIAPRHSDVAVDRLILSAGLERHCLHAKRYRISRYEALQVDSRYYSNVHAWRVSVGIGWGLISRGFGWGFPLQTIVRRQFISPRAVYLVRDDYQVARLWSFGAQVGVQVLELLQLCTVLLGDRLQRLALPHDVAFQRRPLLLFGLHHLNGDRRLTLHSTSRDSAH